MKVFLSCTKLRINNQESGFFMASLLTALRNHLIFLTLPQGG